MDHTRNLQPDGLRSSSSESSPNPSQRGGGARACSLGDHSTNANIIDIPFCSKVPDWCDPPRQALCSRPHPTRFTMSFDLTARKTPIRLSAAKASLHKGFLRPRSLNAD
ncbi:hypothetical protein ABG768_028171 [Culter alburnus]|uniref:Uncharacterized protein n=1 Tax=Culter alburnus TaxID=194366 RepID=A0AAW2A9P1_CULAL